MRIIIKNTVGIPIYEQIKEQIKEAILSGELAEGELLPSIRQLARDLRISVITTTRAYTDLEQEGYIAVMQGKGCYVLPRSSEMVREQLLKKIEGNLTAAAATGRTAKITPDEMMRIFQSILEENTNG